MQQIIFENGGFEKLKEQLQEKKYSSLFLLVDTNTDVYCRAIVENALGTDFIKIIIPSGELHKNIETCTKIWQVLLDNAADRNALLINLGGGVIGDMGGFCAATYKRGIDFIQVPTTLLSMVDASVGGKLGIDFGGVKNPVGVFQNPQATFIYEGFLKTLPFGELRSGFAEVIKHALIADKNYWEQIAKITNLNDEIIDWAGIIKKSIEIKSVIVEKDPLEKGLRKILNFGHTIGHALESLSLETEHPLLHGEAIAIGMLAEAYCSNKVLSLPDSVLMNICQYIKSIFPYRDISFYNADKFNILLLNDKKNIGKISFSLIDDIGRAKYDNSVSQDLTYEGLEFYKKVYANKSLV